MEKCDGYDRLIFGVRRSARYHTKRRQHFERISKAIKIITTFSGVGTFVTILTKAVGPAGALVFSAIVAFFSTIDLILGTAQMARLHSDLARRFITLEKEMTIAGINTGESALTAFAAQRLEIESEEPPKLGILDIICHNELAKAMGYSREEQVELNWKQRLLSNFWDIGLHTACKNNHS